MPVKEKDRSLASAIGRPAGERFGGFCEGLPWRDFFEWLLKPAPQEREPEEPGWRLSCGWDGAPGPKAGRYGTRGSGGGGGGFQFGREVGGV